MATTVLTYCDYAALPDDGLRHELHDGELSVTPASLDVILSPRTVLQPDPVYLDPSRLARLSNRGIEGAPAPVVEVLSPSTATIDRQMKRRLYARHGVPYFWLVDPGARVVEAFVLEPQGYVLALRAEGPAPVSPPPFAGLAPIPATLWEWGERPRPGRARHNERVELLEGILVPMTPIGDEHAACVLGVGDLLHERLARRVWGSVQNSIAIAHGLPQPAVVVLRRQPDC